MPVSEGSVSRLKRILLLRWSAQEPDIATVCTVSELRRVYPLLKTIVEHGVNVVTLAEEAFFPRAVDPRLADDLDTLAKKHQVTVLGTGMQDLFWQSLSLVLAGGVHKLRAIRGANRAVGDGSWGKTNADAVYAGWTVEEYEAAQKQSAREGELEQRSRSSELPFTPWQRKWGFM